MLSMLQPPRRTLPFGPTRLARRQLRQHMDRLPTAVPLATELLGFAAGSLSVVCFVPQAVLIYRGQGTADLSVPSFVALCAAALLWMAYGIARADWPLILTNVFQVLTILYIICKILSNAKRRRAEHPPDPVESAEGPQPPTDESRQELMQA